MGFQIKILTMNMDQECRSFTQKLLSECKESKRDNITDLDRGVVTQATMERYLGYEARFGKYKGHTFKEIVLEDRDYFLWMLRKAMNPASRTWQVLAAGFLTEDQRSLAMRTFRFVKTTSPDAKTVG